MYTNSPLVNYTDITDHNYGTRTHAIDTITIHHMAGNLSVQTCGKLFHKKASVSIIDSNVGNLAENSGEKLLEKAGCANKAKCAAGACNCLINAQEVCHSGANERIAYSLTGQGEGFAV